MDRKTWSLEEFHGGIDLRDGDFSANQTRFKELLNVRVTKGRKIRRRPPCLQTTGALDAQTQGLVNIDGQLYTFAKSGDTIAHTGTVAATVQTLYFNNPDYATTWTLLAAGVFDGYAVALIRHTFPSTTYPSFVALHAWDGLVYAPTWVQDPYFPGSFTPSIADISDQLFSAAFRPVIGQGATKLWTSTNKGNAHCSRTADARVWNQRTKDSLLEDGEHWCFIVPDGISTTRNFIVPRDASWLTIDGRWAYYVLERNIGGVWTPMTEVSGAPSTDWTWRAVSVASRFAGGWNEIQLQIRWGAAAGGLVRLRMVAGATSVELDSEPTATPVTVSGGSGWGVLIATHTYRYRGGAGVTVNQHVTAALTSGKTYLVSATPDNSGFPELWNETDNGFPNGWEREHRRFLKRIVAPVIDTGATAINSAWDEVVPLPGTVEITAGAKPITGTGTNFTTSLSNGDYVVIDGTEVGVIDTVTGDLLAAAAVNWPNAKGPGVSISRYDQHYARFDGVNTAISVTGVSPAVGQTIRTGSTSHVVVAVAGSLVYVAGDQTATWDAPAVLTVTSDPVVTDYVYAYEAEANSSWYTDRVIEYVDQAGAEDALSIATATHDNTGGLITSISSIRQRMLITYAGSTQLWSIDQDTNRTAYLDTLSFGTSDQATPPAISWYGSIIIPVSTGVRAISVINSNTDNLQDLNIGEPIEPMPLAAFSAGTFWPHYGQAVMAGVVAGALEFRVLDYSRESKITAWAQWTVTGITSVDTDTLIPIAGALWFRSGTALWRFDATATAFRDTLDAAGTGNAYQSKARFLFNDMGQPGRSKRFVGLDLVQIGTCDLQFLLPPYGSSFAAEADGPAVDGPRVEGITYGRTRLPLAMCATAVAPVVTSTDETGWELQRLAIDFLNLRR
jgi:hypothetical protein